MNLTAICFAIMSITLSSLMLIANTASAYSPEASDDYAGEMLYGTYSDYYATADEKVHLTNAPAGAQRVDIVDQSGNVIASSPIADKKASVDVGQYHFPIPAYIRIFDGSNLEVVSTPSLTGVYGGDTYSVRVD